MSYSSEEVKLAHRRLREKFDDLAEKSSIRRAPELTALYEQIKTMPQDKRAGFGKEVNQLKTEIEDWIKQSKATSFNRKNIDVTAPLDINSDKPDLLPTSNGTKHPLMTELEVILNIFSRMGFEQVTSPELDDDYHMFTSLNFPQDHPARDDYDTFVTEEGLIAPAHTSTMQNRVLSAHKSDLYGGKPIAAVIPGRVFRNEDLDARHEHTFYQLEGIYVDKNVSVSHLITLQQKFFEEYYQRSIEVKMQPAYFPFVEPGMEFSMSCPFCQKKGCNVCSYTGWIEIVPCGMIHPNVLKMAGIDPKVYSGFAWGAGVERLVMMKNDIEDVRYFHSANLNFLRQFP